MFGLEVRQFLHKFTVSGLRYAHFATDANDRLYLPCRESGDFKIFTPDGTLERSINLNGRLLPFQVAPDHNGKLWVSGTLG